jgi:hypothetical protein
MKVDQLNSPQTKTVFVRTQGQLRAVKVPVNPHPSAPEHPMFPIERPQHGKE